MTTVFKIVSASSTRYVRAIDAAHAKVRAYKVWGEKALQAVAIGLQSPDIGATGYNAACREIDAATNTATIRAMQISAGPDSTGRTFYKVSERDKTKIQNKALAMLKMLGM